MVEEEKERLKTNAKDMRDVIDLSESDKQSTPTNLPNAIQDCTDCGYPCKTIHDLEVHIKNQKNEIKISITS